MTNRLRGRSEKDWTVMVIKLVVEVCRVGEIHPGNFIPLNQLDPSAWLHRVRVMVCEGWILSLIKRVSSPSGICDYFLLQPFGGHGNAV